MGFSVAIASTIVLIGLVVLFGSLSAVLVHSLNTLSDTTREYVNRERDKLDVKLELEIETINADSCIIKVKNSGTKTIFLQSQEDFQWNSIVASYQSRWLSGWNKRVEITIDHNDTDSALSNFPVLVYLSNSSSGRNNDDVSFVFDELQNDTNRKKIAVTTSDGTTQCFVEIEKWDDANEEAWLWVKVPSISNSSDTDLYLYYDNAHADNTDYVGDTNSTAGETVWDANFKLVTHMRDDPDTAHLRDSTSSNNDGTKTGAGEPAVTMDGQIADAQVFDGTDDEVDCQNAASLQITGAITVEAWCKPDVATGVYAGIVGKLRYAGGDYAGYALAKHDTDVFRFQVASGGTSEIIDSDADYSDANWHYIVGVHRGDTFYLYVDGVEQTATGTRAIEESGNDFRIGRQYYDYDNRWWEGIIDEVRVSDANRSAAWIKATYESGRDDLVDFGSEEDGNSHWLSYIIEDYTVLDVNVTDTQISFNPSSHSFINPGEEARISFSLPAEAPAILENAAVIIVFVSHYGVSVQAEGVRE
jgi:archaellum component FlaF (FlaF/FlaG flagellin family)